MHCMDDKKATKKESEGDHGNLKNRFATLLTVWRKKNKDQIIGSEEDENFDFDEFFANVKAEVKKEKTVNLQREETPAAPASPRDKTTAKEPIPQKDPPPKEVTTKKTASLELPKSKNTPNGSVASGNKKFVFERRNSTKDVKRGLEEILFAALARSNQLKKPPESTITPELLHNHLSLPNPKKSNSISFNSEDLSHEKRDSKLDDAASDTDSISTLMTLQRLFEVDDPDSIEAKEKKKARKKRKGEAAKEESDSPGIDSDE